MIINVYGGFYLFALGYMGWGCEKPIEE